MNGHHLIMGKITDYLTGNPLPDTHDERYRQKIVRFLVGQKGYAKNDILAKVPVTARAGNRKAIVFTDFAVKSDGLVAMIVKFGPGSLTTRHRPTLAASRLTAPYQVPVAVVTNGETAEILDGDTGKKTAEGFEKIPDKNALAGIMKHRKKTPLSKKRLEIESRLLFVYEVDGACPCDDTIRLL